MGGPEVDGAPRRVLMVSADMGGGHHATGRALQEEVQRLWPGSEVRWVDTLDTMGRWVGPLFRRIYVTNVQATPWLYEFFYSSLWRHRWFATASKGFVSSWAGRRLAGAVETFDPDLILSTYPLGSAGLAWLRRHRSLPVPVGAWVSDFAPHPFWLYRDLDATFLMHPAARAMADLAEPGIPIEVTGPPVESRFHPGDRLAERARLGLPADRFVALVSCGAYGFGAVREAIDALLAGGPGVQVVAACAHNTRLRAELGRRGLPADRLRTLGWTDQMPAWTRAADVVVTNAGGATALEALATGRPVVMYRPIAAHGAANAALMTVSGLAETCSRPGGLTALVTAMARDRAVRGATGEAVRDYLADSQAGADLTRLAGLSPRTPVRPVARVRPVDRDGGRPVMRLAPVRRAWPLRPPDSFFLHVQTRVITQQVGAVITVEPEPGRAPLTAATLIDRIAGRLDVVTTLRRRLVPRGEWRRPGWVADRTVTLAEHVREVSVADEAGLGAVLDRFWSAPLPLDRPPWQLLLVHREGTDSTSLSFKMHHAIGDGMSLIGTLERLMDEAPDPSRTVAVATIGGPGGSARHLAHTVGRVVRGMWELGWHAAAPRNPLNRELTPNRRGVLTVGLPSDEVRRAARAHHVRSSELLLGVLADALRRAGVVGRPGEPTRLRTMLPVAMSTRAGTRTAGNSTGAVAVDLPVGPMDVLDRIQAIRHDLHRRIELGEPHAAAFVMRALGMFPAPVHGWMAGRVYNSHFFNMIASYVPGPRGDRRIAGNRFQAVYPVVALADGVPLGVGIMRYAQVTGLCVLYDESLRTVVAGLPDAIRASFAELVPPGTGQPPSR